MDYLHQVRAAIVKRIPELTNRGCHCSGCECGDVEESIRLSDVLRAIGSYYYAINCLGNIFDTRKKIEEGLCARWNLTTDSLDEQSPETLAFLHSILCKGDE